MATLAQVRDGLSHLGGQIAAGSAVTVDTLGSIITQLIVFVDVMSRLEGGHHQLTTQVAMEVGSIKEKAAQQQGALEVLAGSRGGRDSGSQHRGILESRAVGGLTRLGSDKTTFRMWNERLINVVTAVRFGSRRLFKAMMDYVDQEVGGNFEELFRNSEEGKDMEAGGTSYERMDEDLYSLLMDKTEGEAALRVRGCNPGQGIKAYMVVYKWFMGTSGQAVTDRMKRLMSPATPKAESEIADAIERWMESGRMLESLKQEYKLPDVFKITALEQLMAVGQAKLHFESIKSQDVDFDVMLQKCRDYALRRRLEHSHKGGKDDMDVDVLQGSSEDGMYMGGGHWECSDWGFGSQDVDFVSKGKAKGKGKYGGWTG